MRITHSYRATLIACFLGYVTQAIAINLLPLLFDDVHKISTSTTDKGDDYLIDSDNKKYFIKVAGAKTIEAEISEKDLNAETIVAKYNEIVVQSLYGEMFDVNKVTKIDDKVIIDFDADSVKAIDIVEGEEGQLFYNLARSIEENLGDVHSVYLTMDGGNDFRLGHLWFVAEEPFYSGRGFAE